MPNKTNKEVVVFNVKASIRTSNSRNHNHTTTKASTVKSLSREVRVETSKVEEVRAATVTMECTAVVDNLSETVMLKAATPGLSIKSSQWHLLKPLRGWLQAALKLKSLIFTMRSLKTLLR